MAQGAVKELHSSFIFYLFMFSWVQKNYPAYYSQFREYVDPAAKYAKDKLVIAGNYIAEQTEPARKYLNKKIPEILEKVGSKMIRRENTTQCYSRA